MPSQPRIRAGLATVATCLVVATAGPHLQTPAFKSRIDLSRLSVSVIDNKTGNPVHELTQRDFTVIEDGVRQTLSTFAVESLVSESPRAVASAQAQPPTTENRRVFLIVLGHGRTEGPVQPYEGVIRFLRERLRPRDLVSVLAFNRATPLTTDHEQVAQVVERVKLRNNSLWIRLREEWERVRFKRADISASLQAEIDAVFQPAEGSPLTVRSTANLLARTSEFRKESGEWRPWNRLMFRDLLKVYAGIELLRDVQGEKHLICLTSGLTTPIPLQNDIGLRLDSREDDARLAARANDAHVALDIIHTIDFTQATATSRMASRNVAELSGGQFTSTQTAEAALERIDRSTRQRYVLGYAPTNPLMDGKYRAVTIEVNRPGVTVLHARGYTARPDLPPLDLREVVTRQRLRDAAATDLDQNEITLRAKASVLTEAGSARQVRVDLTIDASRLSLVRVGASWEGVIDLMIVCGDARQRVVGYLNQQMTLSLDDDRYQRATSGGIPYTAIVPLGSAASRVKVLVYSYDADLLGAVSVPVR